MLDSAQFPFLDFFFFLRHSEGDPALTSQVLSSPPKTVRGMTKKEKVCYTLLCLFVGCNFLYCLYREYIFSLQESVYLFVPLALLYDGTP